MDEQNKVVCVTFFMQERLMVTSWNLLHEVADQSKSYLVRGLEQKPQVLSTLGCLGNEAGEPGIEQSPAGSIGSWRVGAKTCELVVPWG